MINVYIDGSSIGNPGKIGIGFVIYRDTKCLIKKSITLGVGTNNFAEYMALIFSLTEVLSSGEKECMIFSDSKLVCEQINGNYKVKNQNIYPLFVLAKNLISKLKRVELKYIPREKNSEADKLAKEASGFML